MQTALGREASAWLAGTALRLRGHDQAVLLAACLCLAPFPPVNFAGLTLIVLNWELVRRGKLPRSELPVLRVAACGLIVYALLWSALGLWLAHSGILPFLAGAVSRMSGWVRHMISGTGAARSSLMHSI